MNQKFEFLKLIDRGRYLSNIKISKSFSEWKYIIESNGLSIVEHKTHLSKTVIQMWDIGLRPLFPVLIKLVNSVEDKERLVDIKKEWIDIFMQFFEPIIELEMTGNLDQNTQKAFHYFLLEKR